MSGKITGGNADVSENMGHAKKAIRKWMKMQGIKIDRLEGAIRKLLRTRESRNNAVTSL
jgi:hypothetical protein